MLVLKHGDATLVRTGARCCIYTMHHALFEPGRAGVKGSLSQSSVPLYRPFAGTLTFFVFFSSPRPTPNFTLESSAALELWPNKVDSPLDGHLPLSDIACKVSASLVSTKFSR